MPVSVRGCLIVHVPSLLFGRESSSVGGSLHLWAVVFICGWSWAVVEWLSWWREWVVVVVGCRVVLVTGGMVGLLRWWLLQTDRVE